MHVTAKNITQPQNKMYKSQWYKWSLWEDTMHNAI